MDWRIKLPWCAASLVAVLMPAAFISRHAVLAASKASIDRVIDKKRQSLTYCFSKMADVKAVGEVGLDGSARYNHTFQTQRRVFSAVVRRAEQLGGRVLNIHSRAAAGQVLETLKQHPKFGTAVLHWCTDSAPLPRLADSLGCWFSVRPTMLEAGNGRTLASVMPIDRVVPESDGPFGMLGDKVLLPWEAVGIAAKLATAWGLPRDVVVAVLQENKRRLISTIDSHCELG